MDPRDTEYFTEFEKSLDAWTDSRMVSRDDLRVMAMFITYLVNLGEADGWRYDGHSWKESSYLGCLVVKATIEGVPSVVFTSAANLLNGMRVFLRKIDAGVLEWVKDKYRG